MLEKTDVISEEQYKSMLDTVYDGTVTIAERYLNPKVSTLHTCSSCGIQFYGKAMWLVGSNEGQRHVCESRYADNVGTRIHSSTGGVGGHYRDNLGRKKVSKEKATQKENIALMEALKLVKEGVSVEDASVETGVPSRKIKYWMEQMKNW
ncbi:hypothetical protein [Priestia megaterium]|uniref:hypothetical protein n=1 Tax=Priestia megaterium TaxID=1404 RepID=UPI00300A70A2